MCKIMKFKPFQVFDECNKFSLKHIKENEPSIKNRDPSRLDRFFERHVQCSVFSVQSSEFRHTKFRSDTNKISELCRSVYFSCASFMNVPARPDVNNTVVMMLNVGHPYTKPIHFIDLTIFSNILCILTKMSLLELKIMTWFGAFFQLIQAKGVAKRYICA